MKTRPLGRRQPRGMALVIVIIVVVLVTALVAFAITVANKDGTQTGKRVHNLTVQNATESALQYGRALFSTNYSQWNSYLALTYPASPTGTAATTFHTAHPELFPPAPSGFTCMVYARDDSDEIPPAAPNPSRDNNLLIYVGAVCTGPANTTAEMSAALIARGSTYGSQSSGGTSGLNNYKSATNAAVH